MSDLTDYERERQERIAANQALLQSLQLDAPTRASRDGTPESKTITKKPAVRKLAARKVAASVVDVGPARETRSRVARTVTLEKQDPEAAKRKREEEDAAKEEEIMERKRAKHADREIETWNPTGKYEVPEALIPLKRHLESVATSGSWARELHASIPSAKRVYKSERSTPATSRPTPTRRGSARKEKAKKEEDSDDEVSLGARHGSDLDLDEDVKPSIGMKSLEKTFAHMSMRAVKRITPDRIYSAAIHPTAEKDLVFVGDRKGWLGIWDASTDSSEVVLKKEGDEEDEYDRHAFVQRVYHDHGTIACLRFDPLKAHSVYASSYDCTIRSLNFETGTWREEVDVDLLAADEEGEGEALVSAFELTHDGNQIWVSDNRGGVLHQDLREPKSSARRWKVSEKKAGCISLNPANQNYFATAHLDRDVRIWDARKLVKLDSKTTSHDDVYEKACTAVFEHGKACSSAYWDPSGRHLLSTSYDSLVRVWDIHPNKLSEQDLGNFKADREIPHDNQTGAYVSVFKATWCPNPNVEPFFTIGNMRRNVDIYSKNGKLLKQLKEQVETVPAVTAMHPSKPVVIAGAAGGKVYYWKADQWH